MRLTVTIDTKDIVDELGEQHPKLSTVEEIDEWIRQNNVGLDEQLESALQDALVELIL